MLASAGRQAKRLLNKLKARNLVYINQSGSLLCPGKVQNKDARSTAQNKSPLFSETPFYVISHLQLLF
jgi:hypothetical protein